MKYNIISNKTLTRRQKKRAVIKWILYSLILVLLYSFMCCGFLGTWQPVLIIPFVLAVSVWEREFQATLFSAFGGLLIDMACSYLFGFSSVWLMIFCLVTSLLVMNLIKPNVVNYIWICGAASVIYAAMNYMFNFFLWFENGKDIILMNFILPPMVTQVVICPLFYYLVRFISSKLGDKHERTLGENITDTPEEEAMRSIKI